jgi:uncharacterized protein (TIGR00255 family)
MTIQSMTGFAEKSFTTPTLRVKFSIKSLNHRFFDWTAKGAPLGRLESRLRDLAQERISRGRVEVTVDIDSRDPASWDIQVNEGLLEKILQTLDRMSARLKRTVTFSLENLFRIPQLVDLRRRDYSAAEVKFLESCFLRTLDGVIRSRRTEGRKTAAEIRTHLRNIRQAVALIERLVRRHPGAVQKKLRRKLKDANGNGTISEERLSEEVSYLSQRYDVSEEIQRLRSHLAAALELLTSPKREPVGKMLDFLAQELTREANTLNAKSQDIGMTREGLRIKNEVEIIRQQVQNIE